jgi:hypothetical protein
MKLAEKLVKKAATECSVCNEALTDVIKKRMARGEDVRTVCNDLAQAIAIEAGVQVFSPNALRNRFLREQEKLARNGPPQKSEKNGEKTRLEKDLEGVTDLNNPHLADCEVKINYDGNREVNLTEAEEAAVGIVAHNRELAAWEAIKELEKALDIRAEGPRSAAVSEALEVFKNIQTYEVEQLLHDRFTELKSDIDMVIKMNNILDVIVPNTLRVMLTNSLNNIKAGS